MMFRCKYNPDCGEFSGPRLLTNHYQREHADVFVEAVKPVRQCRRCGQMLKPSTVGGHMRSHGIEGPPWTLYLRPIGDVRDATAATEPTPRQSRPMDPLPSRVSCSLCPGSDLARNGIAKHFRRKHPGIVWHDKIAAVDDRSPRGEIAILDDRPHLGEHENGVGWNVDDIVLPVIEQLASPLGLVPVSSLAALFVWRDATTTMLRDVTRTDR